MPALHYCVHAAADAGSSGERKLCHGRNSSGAAALLQGPPCMLGAAAGATAHRAGAEGLGSLRAIECLVCRAGRASQHNAAPACSFQGFKGMKMRLNCVFRAVCLGKGSAGPGNLLCSSHEHVQCTACTTCIAFVTKLTMLLNARVSCCGNARELGVSHPPLC